MSIAPLPLDLNQRIRYLDQVRAWAMLGGIFLHASLTYASNEQEFWMLKDSTSSMSMGIFFDFIHLFRMALFFLVAGFFANLLINKRGVGAFLKNRLLRLGLPFLIFWPLIMLSFFGLFVYIGEYLAPHEYSVGFALNLVSIESGLNGGTGLNSSDAPPPNTAHLWFIYNLLMFCLATAFLQRLNMPLLKNYFQRFFSSPRHLLYFPLLLVPAIASVAAPMPPPDKISPQWWSFSYYGLFFLLGWHFFYQPGYLDKIKPLVWPLTLFCLAGCGVYVVLLPSAPSDNISSIAELIHFMTAAPELSPTRIVIVLLEAYLGMYLVILSLYFGRKFLNVENAIMRYISDASYWVYIIHLPLLLFVQVHLVRLSWPPLIKFVLSTAIVFVIAIVLYELLVRYTPIGSMLNGKKVRPGKITGNPIT